MPISPILLWLAAAAGFLILEMSTVALVSLWFAIGSLAALGLSFLGAPFWGQVAGFLVVSGCLLALLRPALRKHTKITKTNVDSVIGSQGLVTKEICNLRGSGEAKLGAMVWTARSSSGEDIPAGTVVRVDRIEGVKVYVTPVNVPVKN